MKKVIWIIGIVVIGAVLFNICFRGTVYSAKVDNRGTSKIYTDSDIESAIETVKDYFKKEFGGCKLTNIGYVGDDALGKLNTDEAIKIYGSFKVGPFGNSEGTLSPNETYGYTWLLRRSADGTWKIFDGGQA